MTKKTPKKRVKAGTSKASAADKRSAFIEVYLSNGGNATQAAISAGYSPHSAERQGIRMTRDVRVSSELDKRRTEVLSKLEITTERVLQEIARLALFDPRKLFRDDGSPKPINELDDDTASAIAGLEVIEEFAGSGEDRVFVGFTKKYKISDKNSALEKLAKHLSLYAPQKIEHSGSITTVTRRVVDTKGGNG